ncbi:unnamed protein product [Polarella glacialis]|uniref:Cationic amino acid transporter C-terminal domain-containing protein n=1 Tax=Polarella glacialis TaxID=89957 RepID=A0A813LFG0_POLGL|nr:unnamed protein product [Polarella glacialis]
MLDQLFTTQTREKLLQASSEGPSHGEGLARSLGTLDLLAIGVGSTVGTGVFSITGQVAASQAGPAVVLCWLAGGTGCLLSALSYIELSARLPVTGSVYAFAYHALGEVFAVVAAACITLEYGISASAVAASWGSKFGKFVTSLGVPGLALSFQLGPITLCLPSLAVLLLVTVLISAGGCIGKAFTRGASALAVVLILGMSGIALTHFEASNFDPFFPPELPPSGILAGCVTTFFGFLGYDEVCCLAGEAADPKKSIPRSVIGTIVIATLLPVLGSLALVGLVPYTQIDPDAGFEVAFRQKGWTTLAHAVSVGELLVLFVVTYMCFLAQPRVFYALAKDGLLPARFLEVDHTGAPRFATQATGLLLMICGALLPFDALANMISGGVCVAFNLVNCCVIVLRQEGDGSRPQGPLGGSFSTGTALGYFVLGSACAFIFLRHAQGSELSAGVGTMLNVLAALCALVALLALIALSRVPVRSLSISEAHRSGSGAGPGAEVFFQVPFVPWLPALAITFNNVMLASLEVRDFALLAGYLALVVGPYLLATRRRHLRRLAGPEAVEVSLAAERHS